MLVVSMNFVEDLRRIMMVLIDSGRTGSGLRQDKSTNIHTGPRLAEFDNYPVARVRQIQ